MAIIRSELKDVPHVQTPCTFTILWPLSWFAARTNNSYLRPIFCLVLTEIYLLEGCLFIVQAVFYCLSLMVAALMVAALMVAALMVVYWGIL